MAHAQQQTSLQDLIDWRAPKITNAEMCREYRHRIKTQDPERYEEMLAQGRERGMVRRSRPLTEEQLMKRREQDRKRAKRYREAKKKRSGGGGSKPKTPKIPAAKTMKAVEQQRTEWREKKRAQRNAWGPQKIRSHREKCLKRYYDLKKSKSVRPKENVRLPPQPVSSPPALVNPVTPTRVSSPTPASIKMETPDSVSTPTCVPSLTLASIKMETPDSVSTPTCVPSLTLDITESIKMNPEDQEWEPPSEADLKLIAARRERSDQISKLMSGYLLKGYKMLGSTCAKCDTILLQDRQGTNYCVACSELDSDTNKDDPAINESAAISMARELEMASAAASVSPSGSHLMSRTGFSLQTSDATADVQQFNSRALTSGSTNVTSLQDQSRIESRPKVSRSDVLPSLSISSIDVQSFTTNVTSSVQDRTYPRYTSASSKPVTEVGADSGFYSAQTEDKKSLGTGDCVLSDSDSVHVSRLQDKINWASQELQNTHSVEYSIHLCQLMKIAAEAMVALRNARM